MTFSTVSVSSCQFENSITYYDSSNPTSSISTSVPGGFIYVSVGVNLTISSSNFVKGNGYAGGAFYMSGNSAVQISDCVFTS